jgi:hypothetical protein
MMKALLSRALVAGTLVVGVGAGIGVTPLHSAVAAPACDHPIQTGTRIYTITRMDNTVLTVSDLGGNLVGGEHIVVNFTIKPGCTNEEISFASYQRPANSPLPRDQQVLYSSATGFFSTGPGSLTIDVPPAGVGPNCPNPKDSDVDNGFGNGANVSGQYDSTCNGQPSLNGKGNGTANGKPCAGCVGNADNKNPPGQFPNGTDPNAGYECDRNQGVGKSNPAHSGCTHFQVDFVQGPVLDHLSDTVNYIGRVMDSTGG